MKELVTAIEARGRAVGIYASAFMWNQIMGNKDSCTNFNAYPLWYAHYDGKESFDDWAAGKFGGWTTPTIKQYAGSAVVCSFEVDLSYY
jgi:GH25 family lysozyme M1 (1,4-beta-N-acetylmuramidase)